MNGAPPTVLSQQLLVPSAFLNSNPISETVHGRPRDAVLWPHAPGAVSCRRAFSFQGLSLGYFILFFQAFHCHSLLCRAAPVTSHRLLTGMGFTHLFFPGSSLAVNQGLSEAFLCGCSRKPSLSYESPTLLSAASF